MGFWDRIQPPTGPATYADDFAGWAFDQARRVREARPNGVDIENVVEELESLGKQEFGTLESVMEIVLLHLLKWDYQPNLRGASWRNSVAEHRRRIAKLVRKNPSLKPLLPDALLEVYETARLRAIGETGLPERLYPLVCPYSWDMMMRRELSLGDPE